MTLEEALKGVTDPEVRKFFENMVANQNSYITKLETQLKELKAKPEGSPSTGDEYTQAYLRRKMREEVIEKAEAMIVEAIGKDVFLAVKPDFDAFLEKNLKPENTREDYVVDAFNLVYGRCLTKKDHPVHQVGKTTPNPSGTPSPTNAGTNGPQVAAVQNVISGQPPVMSGADASAGQGLPGVSGEKVKDTRDAFKRLKDRIANSGGSKFQ